MVVTKILHLNSIYRNRVKNPLQSEFEIDIEGIFNDNTLDPTVDSFPINTGVCTALSAPNVIEIQESSSMDANVNDYYKDMYIDNGDGNYIQIIKYYTTEKSLTSDIAVLASTFPAGTYYIRQKIPLVSTTVGAVGNTTTTVSLVGVSPISDVYKNNYIRLVLATTVEVRKIISFNGTSLVATVETPFSTTPAAGLRVEIGVAKENVGCIRSDFSNTYSQYEIQLLSLIIPINYIVNGSTSTVTDSTEYLSVSLNNVNNGYTVNTYSNNPSNSNAIFLAHCVPNTRAWGVYYSNSIQTIRLNMSKSLKLSIRTSDGQLLNFTLQDSTSPLPPIPLLQINAIFSIIKIIN
jgi:hypothetical protein